MVVFTYPATVLPASASNTADTRILRLLLLTERVEKSGRRQVMQKGKFSGRKVEGETGGQVEVDNERGVVGE